MIGPAASPHDFALRVSGEDDQAHTDVSDSFGSRHAIRGRLDELGEAPGNASGAERARFGLRRITGEALHTPVLASMGEGAFVDANGRFNAMERVDQIETAIAVTSSFGIDKRHGYIADTVAKGLDADMDQVLGKMLTVVTAPIMSVALALARIRINAIPDKDWEIPLHGPDLPIWFMPEAGGYGAPTRDFDQSYDAPGQARDKDRVRDADDPYAGDRSISSKTGAPREASDAAVGNVASESSLRYQDHARLRMQARREGLVAKNAQNVLEEDKPELASAGYTAWRTKKIKTFLAATIDTHATDHSTIMTNPMHAQKALAYDVAIGRCHILDKDLHACRIAADWRFLEGLDIDDPCKVFEEYFFKGKFNKQTVFVWANTASSEGRMPEKIVDVREHQPGPKRPTSHKGNNA